VRYLNPKPHASRTKIIHATIVDASKMEAEACKKEAGNNAS